MSVLMLMHFSLDVVPLHGGIVPKCRAYKSRIVSVRDGNFFSNRIINTWTSLPHAIVSSRSVDIFKRKLHSMSFSWIDY